MVFNATFNNSSAILSGQFYQWKKPQYPEKTTDLLQIKSLTNFIIEYYIEYTSL